MTLIEFAHWVSDGLGTAPEWVWIVVTVLLFTKLLSR